MSESRSRKLGEAALVAVLGVVAGLFSIGRPLGLFDEALILVGSERLLAGELPYRDFYALYPPGQFHVVAALFALFGTQVLTLRLYCILVRAAIGLLIYLLAREISGRTAAIVGWTGGMLWMTAVGNFGYPCFPALALVLGGYALLLRSSKLADDGGRRRRGLALAAGTAIGAAALFRHDLAAYGLIGSLPLLWGARPTEGRQRVRDFALGLAGAFLPIAALVLARAPRAELLFELFVYPFESYAAMRGLPFPKLLPGPFSLGMLSDPARLAVATAGVPYFVTPLLAAAVLVWGARRFARSAVTESDRAPLCALTSLALFALFAQHLARVRPDEIHVLAAIVLAFPIGAAWAAGFGRSRPWLRRTVRIGLALIALLVAMPAIAVLLEARTAGVLATLTAAGDPQRAAQLPALPPTRELAAYVERVVPKGGRIFVGTSRHDRLFQNEPILYFLAGRLPGTRYHGLDPGVATTGRVQREIVADLARHRVEIVVLSRLTAGVNEPNASSLSSGVTALDDYLREHYRTERIFEPWFAVLRRATPWENRTGSP